MNEKFSKIGYILAMAGSAIGLGNAWKFPTMVGNNGGFAFIFLYLILTILIAAIAFLAEAGLGKLSGKNIVSMLNDLAPTNKKFWKCGGIFMFGALLIASFYLLVIGWILYYAFLSLSSLPTTKAQAIQSFTTLIQDDIIASCICYLLIFAIVFYTTLKGIKNGIEKLNYVLMPSLFILLIIMLLYCAYFSDGFSFAVNFIFYPDFSKIFDSNLILQAMGLALFSLSLGVGTVSTYGASTSSDTNLFKALFFIILLNVLVGILMGLIVFSFIQVEYGTKASEGPGLIFISLASLFGSLGITGNIIAVMFFLSLMFAGITSAVSMIEPSVCYLIQEHKFKRKTAVCLIGIFVLILGLCCELSFYSQSTQYFSFFGKTFFDILDYFTSNIFMPLGALFFSIFAGWIVKKETIYKVFSNNAPKIIINLWYFIMKYILPLIIISVGIYQLR